MILLKPGMLSVIQDQGRTGYRSSGVAKSGAMDELAMGIANFLAGNSRNEAVMEMTIKGAALEIVKTARVAFFGADMKPELNSRRLPPNCSIAVKKGDILAFGYAQTGCRCYLAVQGGFDVKPVLGSRSTHLQAKFGGLEGRVLKKGDHLPVKPCFSKEHRDRSPTIWLNPGVSSYFTRETIRFIPGRQYSWFSEEARQLFLKQGYTLSPDSNRMGYRLEGEWPIMIKEKKEMITEGAAPGSIQVPGSGQPIILMTDSQPTGGYPKIGEVISVDLPVLAQKNQVTGSILRL